MAPTFRKIVLGLVLLSVLLAVGGIYLFRAFLANYYFSFYPYLVLIFLFVNSAVFVIFYRSLDKSNNQFIRGFMLSTLIKLMTYMILVLVYVISFPKSAIPFAITLSVLYIVYTAYDLFIMLSLLKRKKEKSILPDQISN
jgi:hypothetical protein